MWHNLFSKKKNIYKMCNYLIEYKYLVIILIVLYGDLYHNLSLKMK